MSYNYPQGTIETKLGKVEWSWTQADHVYIGTPSGEYLELRGVKYHATSHLYLQADGTWQRKEPIYRDPYVSRSIHDSKHNTPPSNSARQALADVLLDAWVLYAVSHPEQGIVAQRCKLGQEVAKLVEEIATLEETLKGKKAEHKTALKALTALGGPVD